MSRYTLGEEAGHGLFVVLDKGVPTKAVASKRAALGDDAEIRGGWFHGGWFHGGWFHGGWFHGGWFHGGGFHGGEFRGGEFHGGEFRGGEFRGGEFHDGEFRGGEFHGGMFHGGWFRGGMFHGGEFRGGEFRGGWLPLQIQGSQHFLNIPDGKTIQIGCKNGTPAWWRKNYKAVGEENGYTESQINEYELYIRLATKIINNSKKEKEA